MGRVGRTRESSVKADVVIVNFLSLASDEPRRNIPIVAIGPVRFQGMCMNTVELADELFFELCSELPQVHRGGQPVALPRKAMALAAYLLLERGPHTRPQLSALLWPESDEAHAAMSLRQALSKLRDLCGSLLHADRQQVAMGEAGTVCSDVHQFQQLVLQDLPRALSMPVHRFLMGMAVDDAPEYAHWCDRTRARLIRQAAKAARAACDDAEARRDWPLMQRLAAAWFRMVPQSADAACRAIDAAVLMHDHAAAHAIAEQFRAALDVDDRGDSPDMVRVHTALRRARTSIDLAVGGVHRTPPDGVAAAFAGRFSPLPDAMLCERDDAWCGICDALVLVQQDGQARRIALAGGIGSGRSRLMGDVLPLLARRGAVTITAQALSPTSASSLPYGTSAALIRSMMDQPALAGVEEGSLRTLQILVPELMDRFASLRRSTVGSPDGTFPVRLQEALTQALLAIAEDSPVVIAVDDGIWSDHEGAQALRAVAQRTTASPILWIVTAADDALQERGNGAWAELVQSCERAELPALSVAAVESILRMAAAGGEPYDGGHDRGTDWWELAQRLHDASHGIPGYLRQSMLRLGERFGPVGPAWLHEMLQVPIALLPARALAYLDALDDVSRTVLLSLALVMEDGHPVPRAAWRTRPALSLSTLSQVHGISRLRAGVIGQRLVDSGLAVEGEAGLHCAHPVVVEHLLRNGSTLLRGEMRHLLRQVLDELVPEAVATAPD